MSTPPPRTNVIASDFLAADQSFKQYHDWYRDFIGDASLQVDKASDVNKQVATFHERLLLVGLGTIGLSVTALVSLAPKLVSFSLSKHIFLWYVAPAWGLLLLSTFMCRVVISHTVVVNRQLFNEWTRLSIGYTLQIGAASVARFSKVISGTIVVDTKERDISDHFAKMCDDLQQKAASFRVNHLEAALKAASGDDPIFRYGSGLAVVLLQLGLVVLCVAAVKLMLAL